MMLLGRMVCPLRRHQLRWWATFNHLLHQTIQQTSHAHISLLTSIAFEAKMVCLPALSSCKNINFILSFYIYIEKITLVFEHYNCDISSKTSFFSDIDSLVKCGLYALYHIHYVIGTVHGLITPDAFLYTGQPKVFKLAHWALNLITNCGQLCQSLICPGCLCSNQPKMTYAHSFYYLQMTPAFFQSNNFLCAIQLAKVISGLLGCQSYT